ncbi:hypothetical protein QBC34DRAFT_27676 [Podospora aff. communis PSN243]|uniref:Uncharacterized protein n=1 Tax=Podospora aff. communis PSN243 TaxID=3040156 RepID=A0AAV9GZL4_9PEZI|nr:hypothetical protein QBC34DRAFT_27676 [Podospora aff. communis PSN243]
MAKTYVRKLTNTRGRRDKWNSGRDLHGRRFIVQVRNTFIQSRAKVGQQPPDMVGENETSNDTLCVCCGKLRAQNQAKKKEVRGLEVGRSRNHTRGVGQITTTRGDENCAGPRESGQGRQSGRWPFLGPAKSTRQAAWHDTYLPRYLLDLQTHPPKTPASRLHGRQTDRDGWARLTEGTSQSNAALSNTCCVAAPGVCGLRAKLAVWVDRGSCETSCSARSSRTVVGMLPGVRRAASIVDPRSPNHAQSSVGKGGSIVIPCIDGYPAPQTVPACQV